MIPIKPGSTSQSVVIRIVDSTTGIPEQAVEHDTSGIALWYRREGATKVAITPAALAALDTAWTEGGIEHIDDGYYRLDVPDAAFAAGVDRVMIGGAFTDMIVMGEQVVLSLASKEDIIDEFETQSQADPTGFHVNVKEVNGTAQTAGDVAADTAAILLDTGTDGVILKAAGLNADAVDKIWDEPLIGTKTARQLVGITLAAFAAGKTSGAATTEVTFRDTEDGFDAIVMTVDADGDRSAVTLNFSA